MGAPFVVYIFIPISSSPYEFGGRLVWGGGLLMLPNALAGVVIGAICFALRCRARRHLGWTMPVSGSLVLGLSAGVLGSVPMGLLAGLSEPRIATLAAIALSAVYLGLVSLRRERREARTSSEALL